MVKAKFRLICCRRHGSRINLFCFLVQPVWTAGNPVAAVGSSMLKIK